MQGQYIIEILDLQLALANAGNEIAKLKAEVKKLKAIISMYEKGPTR